MNRVAAKINVDLKIAKSVVSTIDGNTWVPMLGGSQVRIYLQNAVKNIEEVMNTGMQDWKIFSITETSILDVYEHQIKSTESKEQPAQ